jgi:hypothetical protein
MRAHGKQRINDCIPVTRISLHRLPRTAGLAISCSRGKVPVRKPRGELAVEFSGNEVAAEGAAQPRHARRGCVEKAARLAAKVVVVSPCTTTASADTGKHALHAGQNRTRHFIESRWGF